MVSGLHRRLSGFLVSAEQFDRELTTTEVTAVLEMEEQKWLPEAVLSDRGRQFKEQWRRWCSTRGVEAHFAHPSYPQDKGKVERRVHFRA